MPLDDGALRGRGGGLRARDRGRRAGFSPTPSSRRADCPTRHVTELCARAPCAGGRRREDAERRARQGRPGSQPHSRLLEWGRGRKTRQRDHPDRAAALPGCPRPACSRKVIDSVRGAQCPPSPNNAPSFSRKVSEQRVLRGSADLTLLRPAAGPVTSRHGPHRSLILSTAPGPV